MFNILSNFYTSLIIVSINSIKKSANLSLVVPFLRFTRGNVHHILLV